MCHLHILSNVVRYCNSQINQEISDLMHVNNFGKQYKSVDFCIRPLGYHHSKVI